MNKPIKQLDLVDVLAPENGKPEDLITSFAMKAATTPTLRMKPHPCVDLNPSEAHEDQQRLDNARFEEELWAPDCPDVCIESQPPIACYENNYGAIVIRQRSPDGYDEDPFITVRPENVPALIAAIKRLLP